MSTQSNQALVYENIPLRPDTKEALTALKEVAGMTYDEAVVFLLESIIRPEDRGDYVNVGLRVRASRAKLGNGDTKASRAQRRLVSVGEG